MLKIQKSLSNNISTLFRNLEGKNCTGKQAKLEGGNVGKNR